MGFMDSVKGIAGKVSDSVGKGVKTASEKSKEFNEKSKIKNEIKQLEVQINQAYMAIGKAYFEKNNETPDAEYVDLIQEIVQKSEKAESLKETLNAMSNKLNCPGCGAVISRDQKFCDNCGAKIELPEAAAEEAPEAEAESESEVVDAEIVSEGE